jgi:Spirocyclase AveC-like
MTTTARMAANTLSTTADRDRKPGRRSGVTALWATAGTLAILYTIYVWVAWLSGGPRRPAPGADHYRYILALRLTEFVSTAVFVLLLWYSIVRPLRHRAGLTLDGKLFIGGFAAAAIDPVYGYFNPTWAMNAHALSLGTWAQFIPGHSNRGETHNAWGLLWCLPAYVWLGLGAAIVGTAILNGLRRRFARISTATCYLAVLGVFYAVFAVIENLWLRTEVYAYVSVPSALTLWPGTEHQWPVYSPLLIGLYCLGYTWLRDSVDDRGRSAVDRDIDTWPLARPARAVASLLAVVGLTAAVTLACYQIPWTWLSMLGGSRSIPVLPSYLSPGLACGQPGQPLCPSQYLDRLQHDPGGLPRVPQPRPQP